ncbi:MAG TPA: TolC family protein [Kofleriaceae bacterium]|jgi:outer membrane protein TolC|nr:TolC family protein [Kofleriaceae bacterium]
MTSRISLVLALCAAAPALAQPAPRPPAPRPPAPRPAAAPAAAPDDLAAFDRDLDTLFAAGGLTAEQAASRAQTASPTVRRRAAELDAAIAQRQAAELALVPQVRGTASYTRLSAIQVAPISFPIGGMTINFAFPSPLTNAYLAEAQLAVPLSDYLLRFPALIDTAKLGVEAARIDKRSSEIGAGQDARLAYYEWVRARLQVLIAQRQLVQVQRTLDQVRALAEVQRLSRADLMRVEAQQADAEQTVDQLQNLAQLREEQLRILIGAAPGEPLAVGEDIRAEVQVGGVAAIGDLVDTARRQRLEFKVIDVGIAAKQRQRDAELANSLPRLSAFGVADYADPNQRVFPQVDQFKFTWQVGAQLTWTINDALIAETTKRRIAAEANELRADRQNLDNGTRIEVQSAQQAVALAQHALATTQKGLAAAEESYRVRRELLNAERATAVELVDAETELTRARIAALNARVDLRVAQAQLSHAIGNDAK